ncbi:MAG: DUF2726 domain-containing protein [Lentisphaerae bacterium]|nr:DUF2726 domain-containing protein [Lentisphaerota bacterium]
MRWYMIFVLLLIIFMLAGIVCFMARKQVLEQNKRAGNGIGVTVVRKALLTPNEAAFYTEFQKIMPVGRQLCCKCRLEDLMRIPDNVPGKNAQRNRIKSRHVDFVLFNPITGFTDYAIELDDSSHNTPHRRQDDLFKDELFRQIKMPLIRIKARREYNCMEIQREITAQLNKLPPLP